MGIRECEDNLFNKWKGKYLSSTFVIDGCPNPSVYEKEKNKVVFVLKDGNLGSDFSAPVFDQRGQLENAPHKWWENIAHWCASLSDQALSWEEVKEYLKSDGGLKEVLSRHCFVQLKKEGGVGSVSSEKLDDAIERDKGEVFEQISFYKPDVIVACGNASQLIKVFDLDASDRKETKCGVKYWSFSFCGKVSHIVDYCHPSVRLGNNIKGVVAMGLGTAIESILSS